MVADHKKRGGGKRLGTVGRDSFFGRCVRGSSFVWRRGDWPCAGGRGIEGGDRAYFNVYTAFPLSTETGIGTVNTIRYNRFNTTFTGGVGLKADYDEVFDYALGAPTVSAANLDQTLIIVVPNSTDYGGICQMWESGAAIAFCSRLQTWQQCSLIHCVRARIYG